MEQKDKTYLDYAASTPVDARVLEAMLPYFTQIYGNPSSIHYYGQQAENALENARDRIAELINANPEEIIFTSCGTESDNLALRGTALAQRKKRNANHILISPVEHHAVLHTTEQLADQNDFEVEYLPVDKFGMIDPADVEAYLRSDTAVVSIIYANNEIGSINPIAEIGEICQKRGIPLHTDAVQAAAHLSMDVQCDGVDLMAIGAHKFYGPKGVGALYVRRGLAMTPVQTGGKQESGLRGGTQNVPYIVGMAEAFKLANQEREKRAETLIPMRDKIIGTVLEEIPHTLLTGHPSQRLPNHASFVFEGVDGNALLMMLDIAGFACSSGSACKVGIPKPSEVLTAIGLSPNWALGSLRITLGKDTTPEKVEAFLEVLPKLVEKARNSK
ncbi:MAG: cysteine desulfurase family protein [Anaerolineaceae bacterium]|nr:cysteine desulfurase family protein [Anaerolineaceae bacterium]